MNGTPAAPWTNAPPLPSAPDRDDDRLRSILRGHPLFSAMSDAVIGATIASSRLLPFESGQALLRQGERSDSALLIIEGLVDVVVQTTTGPVTVGEQGPGALLGEIGVFADLPRNATVRARGRGQALWLDRPTILRLGHDDPAVFRFVVGQLGRRLAAFNQAMATYTNALANFDASQFDPRILEDLRHPPPELLNFALTFERLAQQLLERREQRQEMASAAAIQRAMLPNPLPVDPSGRAAVHARIRPAGQVGGDFYDVLFLDPNRIAVTVGDASGKGVPASIFVAVCQTVMRMALREERNLGMAMARANSLIAADNRASMFATCFAAVLHLDTGDLTYCNAGHVAATLIHEAGSERLAETGTPLAAVGSAVYFARKTRLSAGSLLVIHTDGITEAHDGEDRMFGDARLRAVLIPDPLGARLPRRVGCEAADVVASIFATVDAFTGGSPQFDDMTALALFYSGRESGQTRSPGEGP